jgi:3-methyladenine DNA glycosylase AlkC
VQHVTRALERHLPAAYPRALKTVLAAAKHWDAGDPSDPLRGFAAWPLIDYVAHAGLDDFTRSMAALRTLTPLFTAEFAIRPFLERYPKKSLALLRKWAKDKDPAVRRLVSEGTRPRLPWGGHLKAFCEDPRPTLALLELLKDDTSEYVRRSVANHLNDIGKDHPDLLLATCKRWKRGASKERQWIIERATRSLVKAGHPGVFELLGHGSPTHVTMQHLNVTPKRVRLGGSIEFSFTLTSRSKQAESLVIDYAIHHQKADGSLRPKVFKLRRLTLGKGGTVEIQKRHTLRAITTRRYHSGKHAVEILVNGKPMGRRSFTLTVPAA